MPNQIVYPTFKDAQQLYSQYSTIQSVSVLYDNLLRTVDPSFLSTMTEYDIHEIYNRIILNYYPNEICIKSCFIKQVLMNERKHITIFELPVGSSRADLCKINGESIAYEIKTDLDNFVRLKKQINDYYKIFEKVYIICSETNVEKISKLIPENCGLFCYKQNRKKNYKFTLLREASLENKIYALNQLDLLRKNELIAFFPTKFSSVKRTAIINNIMQMYSPDDINQIFKTVLKHRFEKQWTFLKEYHKDILEIDYQWFYKNQIEPSRVYKQQIS